MSGLQCPMVELAKFWDPRFTLPELDDHHIALTLPADTGGIHQLVRDAILIEARAGGLPWSCFAEAECDSSGCVDRAVWPLCTALASGAGRSL